MMVLHEKKSQRITKLITIYPLVTMNICSKCHGNRSNECWDTQVGTEVLNRPTGQYCHAQLHSWCRIFHISFNCSDILSILYFISLFSKPYQHFWEQNPGGEMLKWSNWNILSQKYWKQLVNYPTCVFTFTVEYTNIQYILSGRVVPACRDFGSTKTFKCQNIIIFFYL